MADSEAIITLGIGATPKLAWFVLSGLGGGGPVTLTIQDSWHAHFADGPVDIEPFGYGSNDFVEQWWEEWIIKKRGKRRNIMYSRRRYP